MANSPSAEPTRKKPLKFVGTAVGLGVGWKVGGVGLAVAGTAIGIPAVGVMAVLGGIGYAAGRYADGRLLGDSEGLQEDKE